MPIIRTYPFHSEDDARFKRWRKRNIACFTALFWIPYETSETEVHLIFTEQTVPFTRWLCVVQCDDPTDKTLMEQYLAIHYLP
jgi:hypothetical protein